LRRAGMVCEACVLMAVAGKTEWYAMPDRLLTRPRLEAYPVHLPVVPAQSGRGTAKRTHAYQPTSAPLKLLNGNMVRRAMTMNTEAKINLKIIRHGFRIHLPRAKNTCSAPRIEFCIQIMCSSNSGGEF
jgi:hypothetical protein